MISEKQSIDVVIAIFNEQDNIVPLVQHITGLLKQKFSRITFILVDDGSTDNTQQEIERLHTKNNHICIRYISLAKNYGKDLALKCGIDHSLSDICVMIDGDFQHPPEKIIDACEIIQTGYNIVHIIKEEHTIGPAYRKVGSSLFNRLVNFLTGSPIHLTDFKVMDAKTINALKQYKETSYFSAGIIDIVGLKSTQLSYQPQDRKFGSSKFSFFKLLALAVASIISISVKPLRLSIYSGFFISMISLFYGLYIILETLLLGQPIPGFPTLAAAMFFLGGLQLLFLGILGEYLGKAFIESKQRPQYIVDHIKEF